MGRIGVSPDEWNSAVTTAANNVSSVSGVTVQELGKTTLARFKALIEMEKKIETTLQPCQVHTIDYKLPNSTHSLMKLCSDHYGGGGYILSRQAAAFLLKKILQAIQSFLNRGDW